MFNIIKNCIFTFIIILSASCSQDEAQGKSRSGRYLSRVELLDEATDSGAPRWKVSIYSDKGNLLHESLLGDYSGNFRVYVGWDGDTFWLFDSDTGRATQWSQGVKVWDKHSDIPASEVPDHILPDYAREK